MKKVPAILLVEDEAQQREVLTMLLEMEGLNVVSVESAEEGLRQLSLLDLDMIVTDVKLTGIDGFSFFSKVREDPKYKSLPFIFITGYNDPKAIETVEAFNAAAYVTKPYNLEELLKTVKKYLPSTEPGS
ncbi:MAG: response regulator [Ignavibacteria bacterium]|nr:response regulator [Ignavibacteria bacterium]